MVRFIGCTLGQHDLRLVALAAGLCVLSCLATVNLFDRARRVSDRPRLLWLFATAIVSGSAIWSTHFIAILAFRPGVNIGYGLFLTGLSIVVAILLSLTAFHLLLKNMVAGAGAVLGLAIVTMHYTGMMALYVPGTLHWDPAFVTASIAIALVFGAASLSLLHGSRTPARKAGAALLFAAAICGMHFTAMSAITIAYDPTIAIPNTVIAPNWLAATIALVTALVVALGCVGAFVDVHLARRSVAEAARLRIHVAELEETRRQLEATSEGLREALDEAASANRAKSQFLATMSHELRTPLNAIIGFSEVLSAEMFGSLGNPRYREYADDIRQSGAHLLNLITEILEFSRIEVGHLALNEEPASVTEIIDNATRMMRLAALQEGLTLECDIAELPPVTLDRQRFKQVLLNLLSNAIKFTPVGGRIVVRALWNAENLIIEIADTGIGIAQADMKRAFEAFGQIDSDLNRKHDGAGLGLPLARSIMELHGGKLTLDSHPGKGTTATITLPLSRPCVQAVA